MIGRICQNTVVARQVYPDKMKTAHISSQSVQFSLSQKLQNLVLMRVERFNCTDK